MVDERNKQRLPNGIILENRNKLSISGVTDVGSFDELLVVLFTDYGELHIRGKSLHINKLSLDIAEVNIDGQINSLVYTESKQEKSGMFSKIFR